MPERVKLGILGIGAVFACIYVYDYLRATSGFRHPNSTIARAVVAVG